MVGSASVDPLDDIRGALSGDCFGDRQGMGWDVGGGNSWTSFGGDGTTGGSCLGWLGGRSRNRFGRVSIGSSVRGIFGGVTTGFSCRSLAASYCCLNIGTNFLGEAAGSSTPCDRSDVSVGLSE